MEPERNRRGYLGQFRLWSRPPLPVRVRARLWFEAIVRMSIQVVLVPVLLLLGLSMAVGLRLSLAVRRAPAPSPIHDEAATLVDGFAEQYPLHLYPIVAKALELAFLRPRLAPGGALAGASTVVEVAIGEGSFSSRVFGDGAQVTGLDLNPHSLAFAARLPHVRRAIVCDGIEPPLRTGSFDLLLAVNFLHHVSDKGNAVGRWCEIARTVVFSENTRRWASGWTVPYLLRSVGAGGLASRFASRIERQLLQHLEDRPTLQREIGAASAGIEEEVSFFSERCFFYCSLFSLLVRSYGPPTPRILKWIFLNPLRFVAVPLTRTLARLMVRLDMHQDRGTDTYVFFVCRGRGAVSASPAEILRCPVCGSDLAGARCEACGTDYPSAGGMLFLLPPRWSFLYDDYVGAGPASVPAEHL